MSSEIQGIDKIVTVAYSVLRKAAVSAADVLVPATLRSSGRRSNASKAKVRVRGNCSSEFSHALIVPRDLTPNSSCKAACDAYPLRFRQAASSLPIIAVFLGRRCCFGFPSALNAKRAESGFRAGFGNPNTGTELTNSFANFVEKLDVRFLDILGFRLHQGLLFCALREKVNGHS